MAFAGLNYFAVVLAAVASFVFGAVWYSVLSKPWMEAASVDPTSRPPSVLPFVISFVALLIMAWVLAGLIGHLAPAQVTLRTGLISAAFVWLGFVATTLATNHAFQGSPRLLTAIDGGHWLGVLLVQGAVIGGMGV